MQLLNTLDVLGSEGQEIQLGNSPVTKAHLHENLVLALDWLGINHLNQWPEIHGVDPELKGDFPVNFQRIQPLSIY